MTYLATPLDRMAPSYDVVVVGSGYGAAISASRLARAGFRVCVLERGDERQPGDFAEGPIEGMGEVQIDAPNRRVGSANALFDFHVNPDISVLVGCGLGGTSLINANVAIEPDPRVWDDPRWPAAIRADVASRLADGYARARDMLRPSPLPERLPTPNKLKAMERSATHMGAPFMRPELTVSFEDGVNHVGVAQAACNSCGNCVGGCNTGAKNTLLTNYLPDARNHGAEIFTGASVRRVEKKGDGWLVRFELTEGSQRMFGAPAMFVTADIVILGAGSLGSTEILLRSREAGLPTSDQVGAHFTGNGDVIGFAYNADMPIHGIGVGGGRTDGPGPCITGLIDLRGTDKLEDGIIIEEGVIPSTIAPILASGLFMTSRLLGRDTDEGLQDYMKEKARELQAMVPGTSVGAVANTQTFLVMAHDDACGRLELADDRLRIRWPGCGKQGIFSRIDAELYRATEALGGTYIKNPSWSDALGNNLVTVHPLGGCAMADRAEDGVVDDRGRVFAGPSGTAVHEGLYVADGSIMPRSLGVNPFLTICSLAERNTALLAESRGRTVSYDLPSAAASAPVTLTRRVGVQFTETMRGFYAAGADTDFRTAAHVGERAGSPISFTVTVTSDDLKGMLHDHAHRARIHGTVTAPSLSAEPMSVTSGSFELLAKDPDDPRARRMTYRLPLTSVEGKRRLLYGYKLIRDDEGFDVWADTTTLFVTVHDGDDERAPVSGRAVLRIHAKDFAKQLRTMRVTNAGSLLRRITAAAEFGRFFAGALYDTYGGVLAKRSVLDPDAPPRALRELRTDPPESHFFKTADGVSLRMLRFPGEGAEGGVPVLLVHGLGMSGRIFHADTVETNLVEYLHEAGLDVWVVELRASPESGHDTPEFTLDDLARHDLPAAVAHVREVSGAAAIDVVAQGIGAMALQMSLVDGLAGVRSAVCMQAGLHLATPRLSRLKAGLHVPAVLKAFGKQTLSARSGGNGWVSSLFDATLRMLPVELAETCSNPVCRRITFMYGPLYEHEQVNRATHDAMHELFGVTHLTAFEHLTRMVRAGEAVSTGGATYVRDLDRLAIPITFLHGAENAGILPESTQETFDLLRARNGDALYRRHVIRGYGDVDCVIGRDAVRDVFPYILEHLRMDRRGKPKAATANRTYR